MKIEKIVKSWMDNNAPSIYAEGLSWYEALIILSTKINDVIDQVNIYFDEDLEDVVTKILNEWIDDGTIQVIISEALQTQIDDLENKINELPMPITNFPRLSDELDDSKRFERAVNSGYSNIILERNGVYEIDTTHFYTDNVTIHGNNATIHAKTDTSIVFLVGRNAENVPVNVRGLAIKDVNFVGKQTSWEDGLDGSAGIHIPGNVYRRDGGSSNIVIENCRFSKFTVAIMADGVTNLLVNRIYSTNHYFKNLGVAGGYGVLLHSCFDVVIRENSFVGVEGDRHAIYVSNAVGTDIANENITIRDNIINWKDVYPIKGSECAINSRSVKGLTVDNNEIIDGFGGIHVNPTGGDIQDVVIINNRIRNRSHDGGYRGAIVVYANEAFNTQRCLIRGNSIECTTRNADGIGLSSVRLAQVTDNNIFVTGVGTRGMVFQNCTDLMITGNVMQTDNTPRAISYTGTNSNVTVGPNYFENFNDAEISENYIENIRHAMPRAAKVISASDGTVTIQQGADKILVGHGKIASGIELRFSNVCNVEAGDVQIMLATRGAYLFSNFVNPTNNRVYIAVHDIEGNLVELGTADMELIVTINK